MPEERASSHSVGDVQQGGEAALIGRVLAERYRIDGLLGSGGMGRVYLAEHIHMRKKVALKLLLPQLASVREVVKRFEREAVAAANIVHPNIVQATDFGKLEDGTLYLALEFVEGVSLREELKRFGALPPERALEIARQIAEALGAAEGLGVVHRDLKPANVMLQEGSDGDIVKVLDFGVAKMTPRATGDSDPLTRLGAIVGTPGYMAPEQAVAEQVDHRSDLYALGVILYEMLKGERPFDGPSAAAILSKHVHCKAPELPAAVDRRIRDLVSRLLKKRPEERPASARDVASELLAMQRASDPAVRGASMTIPKSVEANAVVVARTVRAVLQSAWRASRPPLLEAWGWLSQRQPWLKLFERRVHIHTVSISFGALAALVLLGAVSGAIIAVAVRGEPRAPAPRESPPLEADQLAQIAEPPTARIDDAELQAIRDKPVYQREVQDWLTLGHAHAQHNEWKKSASAYRNAMQLRSDLKQDQHVLRQLRRAAEDPKAYQHAVNVLINNVGSAGLDLVYDLWENTKDRPTQKHIAEWAYRKLEIHRLTTASKALRVRLELEFAEPDDCDSIRQILELAVVHSDARSVPALQRLQRTDGCGPSGKQDCYPCIREGDALEQALARARNTPAPSL